MSDNEVNEARTVNGTEPGGVSGVATSKPEAMSDSEPVTSGAVIDSGGFWVLGIDFGTHLCSAAVSRDGVVVDVPKLDDSAAIDDNMPLLTVPAFVSVADTGYLVGAEARALARRGDPNTVFDLTRLVGRKVCDLSDADQVRWPFHVVAGDHDKVLVAVSGTNNSVSNPRKLCPEELLAVLFLQLKEDAEALLGTKLQTAALCVPEGFNHTQRRAVRNAGMIAGFSVTRVVCAATAAAVSFGIGSSDPSLPDASARVVMTVDIGASTTNMALVAVKNGSTFEVKAAASDLNLGGNDFTEAIVAHCQRRKPNPSLEFRVPSAGASTPTDTSESQLHDIRQIHHASEVAKKLLSTSTNAVVGIDFPDPSAFGYYNVTRACFEALCEEHWQRILELMNQLLQESSAAKGDIDSIVLLGGSARIPRVQTLIQAFAPSHHVLCTPANVSSARGAALCGRKSRDTRDRLSTAPAAELLDVTLLPLGIQSANGTKIAMIPSNTKLPVHKSFLYYASCQHSVVFHVIEGRVFNIKPGSLPKNPASTALHHQLASVRVDGRHATTHVVLKIDITFDIETSDQIVVTATERSSDRHITVCIDGDETSLSANAIAHANARLFNRIQDSTAMVLVPRNSVLQIPHLTGHLLLSTDDPMKLLDEYVQALRIVIDADQLEGTTISDHDKELVHAISSMLTKRQQPPALPPPPP
ncbi:Heat shock 70 kda protein, partial [Globisporangium splendens]